MKKLCCLAFLLLLAACACPRYAETRDDPDAVWRASHGRVSAMERVEGEARPARSLRGRPSGGGGALLGSVVGGVVGHQIGGGSGRDVATAVGVIAGAVIGNEIAQQNSYETEPSHEVPLSEHYRLTIKLDNGGTRTVAQDQIGSLLIGDRVRLVKGRAYAEQGQP